MSSFFNAETISVHVGIKNSNGYWIEEYTSKSGEKMKLWECPCCGYPTLRELDSFEICFLCWWEDDGQGDGDADRVKGGPNGDYSLTEARKNFREWLIIFRPLDSRFNALRNEKLDSKKREIISIFSELGDDNREDMLRRVNDLKELLMREK